MVDPTQADACRLLQVPTEALTTADFAGYLADIKERLVGETDRLTILYATLWYIARTHAWHFATRIGDKGFSEPNPEHFKQLYLERCNERRVAPTLLGRAKIRKVNSALDDWPDDLNP